MKYTTNCDHCKKETTVSFDSWKNMSEMVLGFMRLSKEQRNIILLMIDGALYRHEHARPFTVATGHCAVDIEQAKYE